LEEDWMQKLVRWSAPLTVLLLVLAACTSASPSGSATGSAAGTAVDAAAICAADAFGCAEVAPGDPIRIASANSFSGATLFLGQDVEYGVEIAMADRGQLFGRDIEPVREDAGCSKAEDGQTAAQAIVADKTIIAVVGTTCSRTAVPAMPVLAQAGITMISASNTAPSLTNPDSPDFGGPFYFRTAYNDKVQGAAVAKFACDELHAKTAATIHDGSPYAEQLQQVFQDEFKAQCGGTTTAHEAIQVGDTDFHPVLTTVCAGHPDLLFYPIFDPEGPILTNQTQEVADCVGIKLVGADGIKDDGFVSVAGPLAEQLGMYFSGPDLNFGDKYTNDFLPKYRVLSGTANPIAPYHAHGYDAANILLDAIAAVGVQDADGTLWIPRDALRAYVAGLKDYPGLTGDLTCDPNGDCGSSFVSIAQLTKHDPVPPATTPTFTFDSVFTTRPAS
jgi:branched-chain amino acid transport system substrate-binding protein